MKLQFDLRHAPRIHPFTYYEDLARAFYRRVPSYLEHDVQSLHSIGWVRGPVDVTRHGFVFGEPSTWSLGVAETDPAEQFLASVDEDPEIIDGVRIESVTVVQPPAGRATYFAESPILLRDGPDHVRYDDERADTILTHTIRNKLARLEIPDDVTAQVTGTFAEDEGAKTKVVQIGQARYRTNVCPIEVTAPDPLLHELVMSMGVGGLTGMGLGAILPIAYVRS